MSDKVKVKRKLKLKVEQPKLDPPVQVVRGLDSVAEMTVDRRTFTCDAHDLKVLSVLGRGAFGVVEKMRHMPTGIEMAVKRIPASVDSDDQKQLLMDLDVSMRSATCNFTAHFYGALFCEGDVWICMEIMDASLDKFYPRVFANDMTMPEEFIGVLSCSILRGLHYLASELKVMHRDVKPSNILVSRAGPIKLCDFGISGHLVDSMAKTMTAGCKPYMGPERINPEPEKQGYDVRSDIWSFGITVVEIATGKYPYPEHVKTPFAQLKAVVEEESPSLPEGFSPVLRDFVDKCLHKDFEQRPKYRELRNHDFIVKHTDSDFDTPAFVTRILDLPSPSS